MNRIGDAARYTPQDEYQGLRQVFELLVSDVPLATLLTRLIRALESQCGGGMLGSILLLDPLTGRLRHGAAPSLPSTYNDAVDGIIIGPRAGSRGTAAYTGKTVYVADIRTDGLWRDVRDLAERHGLRACWSTPILSRDGQVLGTFAIYYREPGPAESPDPRLVEMATHAAAMAIERKRSVEELRRSEARFRALVTATTDAVYRMNPDWSELRQLDGNDFVAGSPEPDSAWLGKHIHSEDQSRVLAAICEAIQEKSTFQLEHRVWRADGTVGWTLSRVVPILDENGDIVEWFGVDSDVTEQKVTLQAQQASERLLEQVFEAAPAFMAVLRGPDLVFEKANPAYYAVVGHGRVLIGKPLLEALPEALGQPFPDILQGVMQTGQPYYGKEASVLLKRGEDEPLAERFVDLVFEPLRDPDGVISGVLVHGVDLTDRVTAEKSLRQAEQRLRFVMDSMPQKIFTAAPDGDIDYLNQSWSEYAGFSVELMQDWTGFVHPDDREENIRVWQHSIATGQAFQFEQRFRRADGAYRWHISRAAAMKNAAGDVLMWIGSNTDIDEQRQTANELRALAAELSDADRRKDEFIALLAHELRNPLAPISNALQIIRMADSNKDNMQFATAVMERQVTQLVRLVDDLLDVSRISRGKIELRYEQVDLAQAIEHCIEAAQPLVQGRGQVLSVTLPTQALTVHVDPTRLAQIIGNLLINASKFTDKGGRIGLHAGREGTEAVIRISDTGIGIASDQLPRIFDMFTQLDASLERSVSGLGIGLSLVRTLVELQAGTVTAHSGGLGHGSEFTVRLPLDAACEGAQRAPPENDGSNVHR